MFCVLIHFVDRLGLAKGGQVFLVPYVFWLCLSTLHDKEVSF